MYDRLDEVSASLRSWRRGVDQIRRQIQKLSNLGEERLALRIIRTDAPMPYRSSGPIPLYDCPSSWHGLHLPLIIKTTMGASPPPPLKNDVKTPVWTARGNGIVVLTRHLGPHAKWVCTCAAPECSGNNTSGDFLSWQVWGRRCFLKDETTPPKNRS